jgi:hypothetical protein
MKWAHLPVAGGIYDQHPQFVDEIRFIFAERDKAREEDAKRREQEMKRGGGGRVAGRRGR